MGLSIAASLGISMALGYVADKASDKVALGMVSMMTILSTFFLSIKSIILTYLSLAILGIFMRSMMPIARRISITCYGSKRYRIS